MTLWRWIYVQKRSLFHQEDHLISRIFHSRANQTIFSIAEKRPIKFSFILPFKFDKLLRCVVGIESKTHYFKVTFYQFSHRTMMLSPSVSIKSVIMLVMQLSLTNQRFLFRICLNIKDKELEKGKKISYDGWSRGSGILGHPPATKYFSIS